MNLLIHPDITIVQNSVRDLYAHLGTIDSIFTNQDKYSSFLLVLQS